MKKKLITLLIFFTLILAACGSSLSATQANSAQQNTSLPTGTELIVGTLKLEGTQQTVTNEQAKELLYMWKAYRTLYNNDNTAQAEIDALIKQIEGTMTTDQMTAISAMNLAQQDVSALAQEQGIQVSSSSDSSTLQTSTGSTPPDGGGMAGGTPPDNAMGGMLDTGQTTGSGQSQPAAASGGASSTGANTTVLVEALIQVLEQKISA
jgi:hypothetical protein